MPRQMKPSELAEAIGEQLVGVSAAAKILDKLPANFGRYRPRLTEVPIEGSTPAFIRGEVEDLAEELKSD